PSPPAPHRTPSDRPMAKSWPFPLRGGNDQTTSRRSCATSGYASYSLVGNQIFHVADQHFIVRLRAPANVAFGVGVGWVLLTVVIPAGDAQFRAARESQRFCVAIEQLPIEIVPGDVEQNFR